jgi:acyl carrier protein
MSDMVNEGIKAILIEVLGVDPAKIKIDQATRLLGSLPEFDSMAVVSVLTAIEDHFGIAVDDDEIDASMFETVGSLCQFVESKLA